MFSSAPSAKAISVMVDVPDWTEKLQFLVRDRLPRSVSRDKIPVPLKKQIETIDNIKNLAQVLDLNRTTIYAAPSEATLCEIKKLYRIEPEAGIARGSFRPERFETSSTNTELSMAASRSLNKGKDWQPQSV